MAKNLLEQKFATGFFIFWKKPVVVLEGWKMICDKNVAVGEEPEEYMDIDKADHENDHRWDIEDYLFEQFKEMKIEGSLNNSKQR